ncbi:MAG: glycosyltransferase, partial [Faecalibacillus sp.]
MRISIAMATFNGENFVNLQLKSIIMQTLKPDEIVIVDDCSSDSTIDIINNFKKEYS